MVMNECFAAAGDAGSAYYTACFSNLTGATGYFVGMRVTPPQGNVSATTFFRTPACPDAGTDAARDVTSGPDVTDVATGDASDTGGMTDGGVDATDEGSLDASMDATAAE